MNFRFDPEQRELQRKVRALANDQLAPIAGEIEESDEIKPEMVRILAKADLFRLLFPKEYGGLGDVSSLKICIAREEISRISLVADTTLIMSGLGCYAVARFGTEQQKRRYIPPLASGEKLGSFGLTEPTAGSDIGSMLSTAVLDGDCYVLNGKKRFISSGNAADTLVVFAKTEPEMRIKGISAFIVEKGMAGFESRRMRLMFAHDLAELSFANCRVPRENLLGEPGQGTKIALGNLSVFRPTLGASAIGSAQAAFDEALSYAKKRAAFGQPIGNFQAIQFKLAEMAVALDAARLMVYRAAWLRDEVAAGGGEGQTEGMIVKEASMAKLIASEALRSIADQSIRIHGGIGIVKGMPIERIYRQTHGALFGEGTSETQLMTIGRQLLK